MFLWTLNEHIIMYVNCLGKAIVHDSILFLVTIIACENLNYMYLPNVSKVEQYSQIGNMF